MASHAANAPMKMKIVIETTMMFWYWDSSGSSIASWAPAINNKVTKYMNPKTTMEWSIPLSNFRLGVLMNA